MYLSQFCVLTRQLEGEQVTQIAPAYVPPPGDVDKAIDVGARVALSWGRPIPSIFHLVPSPSREIEMPEVVKVHFSIRSTKPVGDFQRTCDRYYLHTYI
jgi:hypothetical protein